MKRRNAPKQIDLDKDDAKADSFSPNSSNASPRRSQVDTAQSSSASHFQVPLFKRRVSTKRGSVEPKVELNTSKGTAKIVAPGTPWEEMDLSDSFLGALHNGFEPKRSWWSRRRAIFIIGGLLGVFLGWLFTEGDSMRSFSGLDLDSFTAFDMHSLMADFPSFSSLNINMTEFLSPGREWLTAKSTSFAIGREAVDRGRKKKHAVIIVPGIISSGLESWSTAPDSATFFRKRIWAGTAMIRAIVGSKDAWVKSMSLDEFTGLDPPGYKVRAAQGLEAASAFLPGYWLWSRIIENLAVLDYDHSDLQLMAYDWRLSYYNLEVRDQYFSRLKSQIDLNLAVNGKKTALLSHSMGSILVLWFFKWVENPEYGRGGPTWVEDHVSDWVNIAGTMLGVPKAMSALLSGEMRDTVELNAAGVYLLEKFFSRSERAKLFRSWAGATSMLLKGGNDVWGDENSAPDDEHEAALSKGKIYYFKPQSLSNDTDINSETANPNLTMNTAVPFILNHVPPAYQTMIHTNYSFGFERDPEVIKANNGRHQAWTNPLEVELPTAPSMSIYCLYGVGKETERAYFYQNGGYEHDETMTAFNATCQDPECTNQTPRSPLDLPLSRRVWVDSSVTLDDKHEPKVRSGVVFGDGDGTVSLLSLGAMCEEGWKRKLYNPAGIKVVTHEIDHRPQASDPLRGGATTSDHVDILGNSELHEAIIDIVTGHGENIQPQYFSRIRDFVKKIRWDGVGAQTTGDVPPPSP